MLAFTRRMMLGATRFAACTALVLLLPTMAAAQSTTGSLSGTVLSPDGSAIGFATVTVSGDQGERKATANDAGKFLVAFLTPGYYNVTVSAEGNGSLTDEGVRIYLGQRTSRRYVMVPEMTEDMEVKGTAAEVIDLSTATTGANISTKLAETLPLTRNVSDVVFLAPGVKDSGGSNTGPGSSNPSIGGASGFENQYVFDGVNVTNAGYGSLGAYSGSYGSQGQGINFSFIEETQILTGGLNAEYGQTTGGIVNVVTKSGSNEWEGSVFSYYTPRGLAADYQRPNLDLPSTKGEGTTQIDYGFTVGGPIVKDKLFFWAGVNPVKTTTKWKADPSYGLSDEGTISQIQDHLNYALKLTFQPAPDHRIDLSTFGDPTDRNSFGSLRNDDRDNFTEFEYGGENYKLGYTGQITPNFLVEVGVFKNKTDFKDIIQEAGNTHRIIDRTIDRTVSEIGGIGFVELGNESKRDGLEAKLTNIVGNHTIKYGLSWEDITYTEVSTYSGPGFTSFDGTTDWTSPATQTTTTGGIALRVDSNLPIDFSADPNVQEFNSDGDPIVYHVVRGRTTPEGAKTTSEYLGIFLQDDWAITPDLHLNMGLRYDKQDVVGAIGYDFPGEFSPRIGLQWDHLGNGRSKVYGFWGRYFEKVPLDIAVRLFSPQTSIDGWYYDRDFENPVEDSNLHDVIGGEAGDIDDIVLPGTRNAKMDEIILGYERQVAKDWVLSAEYTFRELTRVLEDFATNGAFEVDYGLADFGPYFVGNIPPNGDLSEGLYWPKPKRDYHALTLEAQKVAPNWMVNMQYTLSSLQGNYEGLFRNDNGQNDPNLTSLFDFPVGPSLYHTYSSGPLNTDRPHRVQAYGFYQWNNGWTVGSRFFAQSGTPRAKLATLIPYGNGGEVALEKRGDSGRTPSEWRADFSVAKEFNLGTSFPSKITLELEIFNFFNHRYATDWDWDSDIGNGGVFCYDWEDDTIPDADKQCHSLEEARDLYVESVADGTPNPDYGKPTAFNAGRSVQFGVKWTF